MKRIIQLSIVAFIASSSAQAGEYGMAGCGLGSLVIKNDGIVQFLAATTNGFMGTQSFGITSGTSNCTKDGVVMADKEQEAFMEANFEAMQRDIAAGGGEHLAAFGTLLGCGEAIRPDLYSAAQSSYGMTFPSKDTTSLQALYMLKIELSNVRDVKASCTRI